MPGGSFPKLLAFVLIPLDLNLFKTYTLYFLESSVFIYFKLIYLFIEKCVMYVCV